MKGYLLLYNTKNRGDITRINHELFGRIIIVSKKSSKNRYYYQGCFENIKHIKFTNGCYFTLEKGTDCNKLVNYISADIDIPESAFVTGREKWLEFANSHGYEVKNLNK